ncbi:MAG: bifunctional pyr operon transcriptional regulator/uracil phosphoribosyltransferase PyrR [Actinomycetota bacterium]|nr:bifunctional pyr operon transcriptional regulator/uracil phosphoribosyltransferase PyrR [Actinomycetota bacterium]
MSDTDVARTVDRIAHQIIEKLAGSTDAVLIGIPTRGATLAHRLAARIAAFGGGDLPVGILDITLFRDDLRRVGVRPLTETVEPAGGIDGKLVILVDDVLFSGRSTRAALDALREQGRPRAVQLAVLVDRGHRQLPIRADYVGKNLPTTRGGSVRVRLAETDGEDCVYVSEGTR